MRPEILFPLFAPVTALAGVGPRFAKLFERLAGPQVVSLLWHLPSGIVDRRFAPKIADAPSGDASMFMRHAGPLFGFMADAVRRGQHEGIFLQIDPVHLASTITGATVFFALGTRLLGSAWPHDPFSPAQLEAHREAIARFGQGMKAIDAIARRLT